MFEMGNERGEFGIESLKRFLQVCVPFFELSDFNFQRGDLTCELDVPGFGGTAATCGAAAAIRGRISSSAGATAATRGGRALPESQYGF